MPILLSLKVDKGKRILRGINHFWSIIMDRHHAGQTFSIEDIDLASCVHLGTIRDYVRKLEKASLIEMVEPADTMLRCRYRPLVIQSDAPRVRRDGSMIESQSASRCMWNLMRGPTGREGFTYRDVVDYCQTDETPITVKSAKYYIQMLSAAGYLIKIDPGKPGTPATWKLDPAMNTGPRAPTILRNRLVFDPNRNDVVGEVEAEEVEL